MALCKRTLPALVAILALTESSVALFGVEKPSISSRQESSSDLVRRIYHGCGSPLEPSVFELTRAAFVLGRRTLYIDGGEYTSKSNGNVNIRKYPRLHSESRSFLTENLFSQSYSRDRPVHNFLNSNKEQWHPDTSDRKRSMSKLQSGTFLG